MKKTNKKKNFIWNTIGTTIYAFSSLFLMIIVTRINGTQEAGIFTFSFSLATMLQIIATYAGRTYQVTDRKKEFDDSDYIYHRIITCIIMFLTGTIYALIKGYSVFKIEVIILLLIYRILDALSETIYAIFQRENDLYKVGISLFIRSFLGIICFLIVDYFTSNLIFSIISLVIISLCTLILYDYTNVKKYSIKNKKINFIQIKRLFISGFFVFAFTFLTQYVINSGKYAIDDLLIEEYQTIFGIILMPATVMSLCTQLIMQPFLVDINHNLIKKDYKGYKNLIIKICLIILIFGLIAELCCYILGIPVLNLLYGIELNEYLLPLLIIIAGSIFLALSTVLSNALIAIRKNKIQTLIYAIVSIVTTIISYILVKRFQIQGAAFAYLLTMALLLMLYIIIFVKEYKKLNKNNIKR